MTASDIFKKICSEYGEGLKHSVKNPSSFIIPAKIHDNKSLFDMIQESIDLTLIYTGDLYMIRDNYGTLEFLIVTDCTHNFTNAEHTMELGLEVGV